MTKDEPRCPGKWHLSRFEMSARRLSAVFFRMGNRRPAWKTQEEITIGYNKSTSEPVEGILGSAPQQRPSLPTQKHRLDPVAELRSTFMVEELKSRLRNALCMVPYIAGSILMEGICRDRLDH